jgi:hypothetical protein
VSALLNDGELRRLYKDVAPAAPEPMPLALRAHLRQWWNRRFTSDELRRFADSNRRGIAITLGHVADDPDTAGLLAPELLLVLHGLRRRPADLRDAWPEARHLGELLLIAEHFATPLSD